MKEPPHLSILASEAFLNSNNATMLRFAREAILKEPRSPRARILMALGLARAGNGRDAIFEVAVAQQLTQSSELAAIIDPSAASQLADHPVQLAARLKPLMTHIPY